MTHSTSSLSCSCCEAKHEHRALLLSLKQVAAPYWNVLLCNLCIETCNDILEEEGIATDAVPFARPARAHTASYTPRRTYRCSFCGREEAQVMRLICLHPENDLRICNLCVGACNTRIAELNKERKRGTMDDLTGDTVDQPPEPVTILHELDLGQHTLFVMSDGSIDLVANDGQTVYLADNALHITGDEAFRLFVALQEQFKPVR